MWNVVQSVFPLRQLSGLTRLSVSRNLAFLFHSQFLAAQWYRPEESVQCSPTLRKGCPTFTVPTATSATALEPLFNTFYAHSHRTDDSFCFLLTRTERSASFSSEVNTSTLGDGCNYGTIHLKWHETVGQWPNEVSVLTLKSQLQNKQPGHHCRLWF